ncbi:MAG TPA: glycosyltransferase family 39 protein [bacterium]|nr:glycosyltransferase family 39 protein [bacterium]
MPRPAESPPTSAPWPVRAAPYLPPLLLLLALYAPFVSPYPFYETDTAMLLARGRLWQPYLLAFPLQMMLTNAIAWLAAGAGATYATAAHGLMLATAAANLLLVVRIGQRAGAAWAASLTAAALATAPLFARNALIFETYGLHCLLVLASLACFFRWLEDRDERALFAALAIAGLGLFHHPMIVAFLPPLLFAGIAAKLPLRRWTALGALTLAALAAQLWVFRDCLDLHNGFFPFVRQTVELTTGIGGYGGRFMDLTIVPHNLGLFWRRATEMLSAPAWAALLALGAAGLVWRRRESAWLAAIIALHALLAFPYAINEIFNYFLPLFGYLLVWAVLGAAAVAERLGEKTYRLVVLALTVLLGLSMLPAAQRSLADMRYKTMQAENRYFLGLTLVADRRADALAEGDELLCNIVNYLDVDAGGHADYCRYPPADSPPLCRTGETLLWLHGLTAIETGHRRLSLKPVKPAVIRFSQPRFFYAPTMVYEMDCDP